MVQIHKIDLKKYKSHDFDFKKYDHEKVVKVVDKKSRLVGFIAVHDSTIGHAEGGLGVSLGGIRMWSYRSEEQALNDVLRLSRGMTYKSAAAEDGCGGAKAVIMGPANMTPQERERLMKAMGEAIELFNTKYPRSRYVGAEDVGTKPKDMKTIGTKTKEIGGLSYGEFDGNPSPYTAYGVLAAMKGAMKVDSMKGKKVAISGVGSVGGALAELLHNEGATVVVADVKSKAIDDLKQKIPGLESVSVKEIHKQDVDVYAPCALGGCLDDKTIPDIKAKYIVGAANNQLLDIKKHGKQLFDAGKIYIPDYIANAGGVMAIAMEVKARREGSELTKQMIYDRVDATIRKNTARVLELSEEQHIPHSETADKIAEEKLIAARKKQPSWVEMVDGGARSGITR